jgi:SNF2 family DNA or RNA helicase
MQILANKTLVVKTRNPARIIETLPESKIVNNYGDGRYEVSVNWGLRESITLNKLNVKNVPSTITRDYKWPRPLHLNPFEHQKATAAFLTLNKRAFCFNEQGTGKTASVIWAADYLMKMGLVKRVLIVCPLSIMQSAWQADLFKFAVHRTVDVAYGAAGKRNKIVQGPAEFVIVNYDGIPAIAESLEKGGFDLIVLDEANAYKNVQTKRWKIMRKLVTDSMGLWMLTGTPAAQSPVDAYGLGRLCVPGRAPRFFGDFREAVMQQFGMYRWEPRPEAEKIVFEMLQPAIRFTKADCLDLPEVTHVTRIATMSAEQKKYYKELKDELLLESGGEEVSAVNAAAKMNKLLQISGGAVYTDTGTVIHFDVSERLRVVEEVISEASHKVLVFVPFRHTIELLSAHLTKAGITNDVIHGDVSVNKRTEIFKRFQETPNPRVLVIQPSAAAHGVTLTAANTVIWYAPVTSTETYLQANARINRPGQRNAMTVVHIQGSPVENRLYTMLQGNINTHVKLVDLYKKELLGT